jgi:hypothetical protein
VDADFVAWLATRATDDSLPPWNLWFDEDPLPRFLPAAAARAAFVADLPRTPVAFLDAAPSPSDAWERLPACYLQLSRRYAAQADWAEARGWPVRRVALHHLAMASDPAEVAAHLASLARKAASDGA